VSVTSRSGEKRWNLPVELRDRKRKIGWDTREIKAGGVGGWLETESCSGNLRKGEERRRRKEEKRKPCFLII